MRKYQATQPDTSLRKRGLRASEAHDANCTCA
jgi:hypothetical protein